MIAKLMTRPTWPIVAGLASATMLAAAHGFERLMYLYPCPLCLNQREVYWTAMGVAVAALIAGPALKRWQIAGWLNLALGVVFLVGAGIAFYHSGVEWGIFHSDCQAADFDPGAYVPPSEGVKEASGACDKAPFYVLGLSMAGWNGVVSLGLAAASFVSGRAKAIAFPHVEAEI